MTGNTIDDMRNPEGLLVLKHNLRNYKVNKAPAGRSKTRHSYLFWLICRQRGQNKRREFNACLSDPSMHSELLPPFPVTLSSCMISCGPLAWNMGLHLGCSEMSTCQTLLYKTVESKCVAIASITKKMSFNFSVSLEARRLLCC